MTVASQNYINDFNHRLIVVHHFSANSKNLRVLSYPNIREKVIYKEFIVNSSWEVYKNHNIR